MAGLANQLEGGAAKLDGMQPSPMANAGESLTLLADTIGRLSEASAGASGGLHQIADDVRASREEYLRSDDQGTEGMPQPPG
ncbi:hypothetical protein GIY23_05010 [Allosaccharopolyspora coralli]|uniref:Uncharacterized protein n=2 Tax=Allosaccharopolyspora coralli TaxID=2665642 RepID=A0A5Q3QDR1_9PSEU|nr:hypothetical protein GIY23_05010 [Allosaccharopolyspora coralli]